MSKSTNATSAKKKATKAKPEVEAPPSETPNETVMTNEPVVESPPSESASTEEMTKIEKKGLPPDSPAANFAAKLASYNERCAVAAKEMKNLVSEGRTLEKEFNSIMKAMSRKTKFVKSNEDRPLSGFAMPSLLSDELYEFLSLQKGTKVPRKDVTRMINEYIKTNSLRDEADRRKIRPNKELHKIFNSADGDDITYFNLQTYMKHHFVKDTSANTVAVA
jgi:chromatin remodeling complex protein RSC6